MSMEPTRPSMGACCDTASELLLRLAMKGSAEAEAAAAAAAAAAVVPGAEKARDAGSRERRNREERSQRLPARWHHMGCK